MGPVLRRRNGTEKNTLLLLLLLNRLALLHACDEVQPPYVKAEKIPLEQNRLALRNIYCEMHLHPVGAENRLVLQQVCDKVQPTL